MTIETTYTQLRAHLASLFDRIVADRQVVIVRRRRGEDIALLPADELESLMETAYLLRSPANARRLLEAYARSGAGEGRPQTIEQLRGELGLDREE
jgi:antitoxin YefM